MDIGDVDVYSFVHLLYEKRNEIEENFSLTERLKETEDLKFLEGIMAKAMKKTAVITLLLTIIFCLIYRVTSNSVILSLAITFGTIAYHFIIRLLVGYLFDFKMKNQADYTKKWYQVSDTEMKLYQKLKVKTWKNKMPTFDMDVFDVSKHSWDEIIQATCQSELVHETNVVFSFLPVVAAIWFGSFEVFLITSMLGAIFDLMFVFMQRFNRARIVKMRRKR